MLMALSHIQLNTNTVYSADPAERQLMKMCMHVLPRSYRGAQCMLSRRHIQLSGWYANINCASKLTGILNTENISSSIAEFWVRNTFQFNKSKMLQFLSTERLQSPVRRNVALKACMGIEHVHLRTSVLSEILSEIVATGLCAKCVSHANGSNVRGGSWAAVPSQRDTLYGYDTRVTGLMEDICASNEG